MNPLMGTSRSSNTGLASPHKKSAATFSEGNLADALRFNKQLVSEVQQTIDMVNDKVEKVKIAKNEFRSNLRKTVLELEQDADDGLEHHKQLLNKYDIEKLNFLYRRKQYIALQKDTNRIKRELKTSFGEHDYIELEDKLRFLTTEISK